MPKTKSARKPKPTDFEDEDAVLKDMAKALDVDPDDLTISRGAAATGYGDTYHVELGQKDYYVVADDDAGEALALESVKADLDESPEMFNQNFIESHINIERLRRDLHSDVYDMRYEDLKEEAEKRPEKFIKNNEGLIEWPEPTDAQIRARARERFDEQDPVEKTSEQIYEEIRGDMTPEEQWAEIGEEPEVPDSDIETVAESEADAALKDPVEYLTDMLGQEDGIKKAIEIAGIDEDAAAEQAVRDDGWQHFVASYDGNSYDTPGGLVYWRHN